MSEDNLYTYRAQVLRVVDGDTLDLRVDLGLHICTDIRVRLRGVDTPEVYGVKKTSEEFAAGKLASDRVQELVGGSDVIIRTHKDGTGKYGRYIVDVLYKNGDVINSLSDVLIQEGLAKKV